MKLYILAFLCLISSFAPAAPGKDWRLAKSDKEAFALASELLQNRLPITSIGGAIAGRVVFDDGTRGGWSAQPTTGQLLQGVSTGAPLWQNIVSLLTAGSNVSITGTTNATISVTSAPPSGSASGDLSGSYPGPTVAKLQGVSVSSAAPTANQVLAYSGSSWQPTTTTATTLPSLTGSNKFLYDSGSGTVGLTSGVMFPGTGQISLNPTSTSATVLGGTMPASFSGNLFNFLDSSSATNVQLYQSATGATQFDLYSATGATTRAGIQMGLNGYQTNNPAPLGLLSGGVNIAGTYTITGMMRFYSNEVQSAGHLGTDVLLNATPVGGSISTNYWAFKGSGSTVLNYTGSPISTSSTDGFLYVANAAGVPTGAATSFTGSTPLIHDSSDNVWFAYDGQWNDLTGGVVKSLTNTSYSMLSTDKIIGVTLVTTPKTMTLCPAASYVGHEVTIFFRGGASVNLTISPASGDSVIYQNASATVKVGNGTSPTFNYFVKLTAVASGVWYVSGGS